MAYDFLYEVNDGIATLTLNRPEVMNALTFEIYAQLRDLFEQLRYDEAVHVVILTGAGDNFCSGGDVHEIIGPLVEMKRRNSADDLLKFTRMTGDVVKADGPGIMCSLVNLIIAIDIHREIGTEIIGNAIDVPVGIQHSFRACVVVG